MNLLLVDPAELAADATFTVRDRRADHLRDVLGATRGAHVRAGITRGGLGTAELLADDGAAITLRLTLTAPPPPPLPIQLALAIPRPKVLSRVIEAAASFGVAHIALTNAWRVDKSYLRSPRLAPDALALAARLGAEQGATTHLPDIAIYPRLMALLDERWPGPRIAAPGDPRVSRPTAVSSDASSAHDAPATPDAPAPRDSSTAHGSPGLQASSTAPDPPGASIRLIAHPGAPPIEAAVPGERLGPALARIRPGSAPVVLAIGPEGGWIAREVETFLARGFVPVSLGAPILRVEAAVAAALGQLLLLGRLAQRAAAR